MFFVLHNDAFLFFIFVKRLPGKNDEASKVLETQLSKAKAGSDEEVSLKLCIAQVRRTFLTCKAGDLLCRPQ